MARKEKEIKKVKEEKATEAEIEVTTPVEVAVPVVSVKASGWIKVTPEELMKYQAERRLVGYRPDTSEALIK